MPLPQGQGSLRPTFDPAAGLESPAEDAEDEDRKTAEPGAASAATVAAAVDAPSLTAPDAPSRPAAASPEAFPVPACPDSTRRTADRAAIEDAGDAVVEGATAGRG